MTVLELMSRSLRMLLVIDPGQTIGGAEAATNLPALNHMMARWEEDGVSVGWAPATNIANAVTAPDSALEGIAANLAVVLAPEYGVTPSAVVAAMADGGYRAIQRDSIKDTIEPVEMTHIPATDDSGFDINTGD